MKNSDVKKIIKCMDSYSIETGYDGNLFPIPTNNEAFHWLQHRVYNDILIIHHPDGDEKMSMVNFVNTMFVFTKFNQIASNSEESDVFVNLISQLYVNANEIVMRTDIVLITEEDD
jgi:hypothetical protein